MERFEKQYEAQDKITGDVYVCDNPPTDYNEQLVFAIFYNVVIFNVNWLTVHNKYNIVEIFDSRNT